MKQDVSTEREETGRRTRRIARNRSVLNWVWALGLLACGALLARPHWSLGTERSDLAVDAGGLLLLAAGIWIRILARGWKHQSPGRGLVTDGLYGYMRHPLYAGTFLMGLGLCTVA